MSGWPMEGVREYSEKYEVEFRVDEESGRPVVRAWNEGHCNCTEVDLQDLIHWLKTNKPELLT
jgi:hypothetical protein